MSDLIMKAWASAPGNPCSKSFRESWKALPICVRILFIAFTLDLLLFCFSPLLKMLNHLIAQLILLGVSLVACVLLAVWAYRNHHEDAEDLAFYVEWRSTLQRLDVLDRSMLAVCLTNANHEIDIANSKRNTTFAFCGLTFSITIPFASLTISKLIENKTTLTAILCILLAYIGALMLLVLIWELINFRLVISKRNRQLIPFAQDLSAFLMLGMEREGQDVNLRYYLSETEGTSELASKKLLDQQSASTRSADC